MATLNFENNKRNVLSQMAKFAQNLPRKIPYTDKTTKDLGFWLVKDDGIYLMSPTEKNFSIKPDDINTVVYAKGFKPTKNNFGTLWGKTHSISPDDFTEFVSLAPKQYANVLNGGDITIKLTETTVEVIA